MSSRVLRVEKPGEEVFSSAKRIGELLKEELLKEPNFYFFSPDETTSNRFDAVFEASERAWGLERRNWDLPESEDGRIVEMLSENTLFAVMMGHLMNGEKAMMGSYESFFSVILSQILQQIKFFKQSDEALWRPKYPAVNLLSTSMCWRQDHNGFTHQSPALISALLAVPGEKVNCLFPIDDVAAEAAFRFMLNTENVVNLTTFDKNLTPRWIDSQHAEFQLKNGGASIFGFASDGDGDALSVEPDYVFTAAGDVVSRESLAAMKIIREDMPELKMRFIGVAALTNGAIGTTNEKLRQEVFDEYYTKNKPIVANFHGYKEVFRDILRNYADSSRIFAHGFCEKGTTTTPFEMLAMNKASRYDLAIEVAEMEGREDLVAKYREILAQNGENARMFGVDLVEI